MDTETERLVIGVSWFALVWFASSGLLLIMMQALLPRGWEQIRARPPSARPGWAYALWSRQREVYGGVMFLAFMIGVVVSILYCLFG